MAGQIRINEDNIPRWVVAGSLSLAALAGLITAIAVSPRFGGSIFVGGLLATANFLWIRRGLEAALSILPANAARFALFRYFGRLAIMALLLYVLIVQVGADIIGLLLGLSVIVVNITVLSIYLSTHKGG
jgi:hypothetical protein